jgi:hypothetical protein
MDDVRGLDTYIFADSQLNYQFDVRLPYSEPSGLFGAAESVWDVRTWHNSHRHCRHAGLQLPDRHHADGCGGECAQ